MIACCRGAGVSGVYADGIEWASQAPVNEGNTPLGAGGRSRPGMPDDGAPGGAAGRSPGAVPPSWRRLAHVAGVRREGIRILNPGILQSPPTPGILARIRGLGRWPGGSPAAPSVGPVGPGGVGLLRLLLGGGRGGLVVPRGLLELLHGLPEALCQGRQLGAAEEQEEDEKDKDPLPAATGNQPGKLDVKGCHVTNLGRITP